MTDELNNFVDLKDHCLLCFREVAKNNDKSPENENTSNEDQNQGQDEEDGFQESEGQSLCKKFLKVLSRYLRLPNAELTVVREEDKSKLTMNTPWEKLITGRVCTACEGLVKSFCDLHFQFDQIKMQMHLRIQELEQCIHFADQDSACSDAKRLLGRKWELDGIDSGHFLNLLSILRDEILANAIKKRNYPLLAIERISESEIRQLSTHTKMQEQRQSLDDSGVSVTSKLSQMPSGKENDSLDCSPAQGPVEQSSGKEYKVMRRVFKCKVCQEKFFAREKLTTHSQTAHPKSVIPSSDDSVSAPSVSPVVTVDPQPLEKIYKIRKKVFVCRANDCDAKFLSEQKLIDHAIAFHTRHSYPLIRPAASNANISTQAQDSESSPSVNDVDANKVSQENNHGVEETLKNQPGPATGTQSMTVKTSATAVQYKHRNYKCEHQGCKKRFHTPNELDLHRQFHRSHQCCFCQETCKNPKALALHEFQQHREEMTGDGVSCPRCPDSSFPHYPSYLKHFINTHLGVKPPLVKCSKCSSNFQTAGFKRHFERCKPRFTVAEIASALSNVACVSAANIGNPNAAVNNRRPVADPVPSRNYVCNICSLPCNSFTALQAHLIATHDPNIVFCDKCERSFKDNNSLQKHISFFHSKSRKLKLWVKRCEHCRIWKNYKSVEKFDAHVRQHEINDKYAKTNRRVRKEKCPECQESFRNLGLHMCVHTEKDVIDNEKSLADRVKMRQRSRGKTYAEEDCEDFASKVETKRCGRKRKLKAPIVGSSKNNDEDNHLAIEAEDVDQEENKRKKIIEPTPTTEVPQIVDSELPASNSVLIEQNGDDSCDSADTIMIAGKSSLNSHLGNLSNTEPTGASTNSNHKVVSAETNNDKSSSVHIKQEACDDSPPSKCPPPPVSGQVEKLLGETGEAQSKIILYASSASKIVSSSKSPGFIDVITSKDNVCNVVSGDELDEDIEIKPDASTDGLNDRVRNWLSSRKDTGPLNVEVITID